ncbi:MAG: VanZ family protein [Geminicoccales bacterium]
MINLLCLAFIGFAIHGSLWPYDVVMPDSEAYRLFFGNLQGGYSRRDLLANILLFMPIGLFGLLGAYRMERLVLRSLLVGAGGFVLAALLQLGQLYIKSRQADLDDIIWNTAGLAIGMTVAFACWRGWEKQRCETSPFWHRLQPPLIPVLVLATWCAYKLVPFVPSLYWANIRGGFFATATPLTFLHDVVGWLIVALVLFRSFPQNAALLLPGMILVVLLLEIVIIGNALRADEILAALMAWGFWQLATDRHRIAVEKTMPVATITLLLVIVFWSYPPAGSLAPSIGDTADLILRSMFGFSFLLSSLVYLGLRRHYGNQQLKQSPSISSVE